ncbi:MAG: DoxX family membrane protein [Candidatus Vogelbacteria bacterium]|nr:DoxX family membrane protein [Candidatus Vogelbacteria bacterium]
MINLFYLGRLLYGGYFFYSGYNHFAKLGSMSQYAASKGVPAPKALVSLSGLLILLGGLWILTGVYVGAGVAEISIFLIIVSYKMHDFWKETDPMQQMMQKTQFLKNMALLGAALMLLQIPVGGWGWTLF